jgi:hypothetical protein
MQTTPWTTRRPSTTRSAIPRPRGVVEHRPLYEPLYRAVVRVDVKQSPRFRSWGCAQGIRSSAVNGGDAKVPTVVERDGLFTATYADGAPTTLAVGGSDVCDTPRVVAPTSPPSPHAKLYYADDEANSQKREDIFFWA